MRTLELSEIQRYPERFMQEIESGEDFVIVEQERTIAEVHPLIPNCRARRAFGLAAGKIQIPDDFNAPFPDEILRDFGEL